MAKAAQSIGALRERVDIQRVAETKDAIGSPIQSWSTLATTWAEVRPASGGEAFRRQQMQASAAWTVILRYRSDLTPQMRIAWRGRLFQIRALENFDLRRRFLGIAADEIATTTLGQQVDAWLPLNLGQALIGWYMGDAGVYVDSGLTLATNGQAVQQWNDQSGKGNHLLQSSAARRPTFASNLQNGKPGINFSRPVRQFLATASLALGGTTASVFGVIKGSPDVANERMIGFQANGDNNDFGFSTSVIFLYCPTINTVASFRDNGVKSSGSIVNGVFTQLGSVYDGTNNTVYIGGSAQTPAFSNPPFGANGTLNVAGWKTAGDPTDPSDSLDGQVLELIFTNTAISAADRANIKTYFANKWGV